MKTSYKIVAHPRSFMALLVCASEAKFKALIMEIYVRQRLKKEMFEKVAHCNRRSRRFR